MTTNEVHAIVHSHSQHLHGANKMCVGFRVDSFTSTNQIKVINFYLSTVMDFIICHNSFFSLDIFFLFSPTMNIFKSQEKKSTNFFLNIFCLFHVYKIRTNLVPNTVYYIFCSVTLKFGTVIGICIQND